MGDMGKPTSILRNRAILEGWSVVALAILLAPLLAPPARAEPTWSCVGPALQTELDRKLQFQDDFAALIAEARPDLAEVAALAASASKARFEIRFSRIAWLWEADRARLANPDAFWSYPWDDGDRAAWHRADGAHAEADDRADALNAELRAHPDAGAYRQFASETRGEEPFLGLLTAFGSDISADRDRVAACF
ncbi:MAG: hypothetical protein AAGI70_05095 [Pseudomonadota bacterium]